MPFELCGLPKGHTYSRDALESVKAGKTGTGRCSLGRAEFLGEKRHFAAATPTVIPDHAALTNHPMAGNNHGNRIMSHSGSHGTGGTGRPILPATDP